MRCEGGKTFSLIEFNIIYIMRTFDCANGELSHR